MTTEDDERVLDCREKYGRYIVNMKDDEGLEDEVKNVNTLPLQLAVSILSKSKRIMNNFIHAIGGFFNNDVYYTDTESLYIENNQWNKLNEKNLVRKKLLRGKNDYGVGGIFYAISLAPKTKYCLTINKYGIVDEKNASKVPPMFLIN